MKPSKNIDPCVIIYLMTQRNRKGQFTKGHKFSVGNKASWKGGRFVDSQGYIRIYKPEHPNVMINKYVFEHRLVMEKHLGRLLKSSEIVHHLDGDKTNNEISNLKLYSSNGKHISKHKRGIKRPEHSKKIKQAWKDGRLTKLPSFGGLKHSVKSKERMSKARKAYWERRVNESS